MQNRPFFLNLWQIKFPITAIVSIAHRVTGVLLFILLPVFLWYWGISLKSFDSFFSVKALLDNCWVRFLIWCFLSSIIYHAIAGLRHLIMDVGIGESKEQSQNSSVFVLILSGALIIYTGYLLW